MILTFFPCHYYRYSESSSSLCSYFRYFAVSIYEALRLYWPIFYILTGSIRIYIDILIGEGNGTPLQYSCLENPMDGRAWKAAVHGVAKSRTQLSDFTFTFHFHALEKEMATHSSVLAWRIRDGGAWWAAVCGVTQSRTWLKWLSSSSRYTDIWFIIISFYFFE